MQISKQAIGEHNQNHLTAHKKQFDFIAETIGDLQHVLQKLLTFKLPYPVGHWAQAEQGLVVFPVAENHEAWKKK